MHVCSTITSWRKPKPPEHFFRMFIFAGWNNVVIKVRFFLVLLIFITFLFKCRRLYIYERAMWNFYNATIAAIMLFLWIIYTTRRKPKSVYLGKMTVKYTWQKCCSIRQHVIAHLTFLFYFFFNDTTTNRWYRLTLDKQCTVNDHIL